MQRSLVALSFISALLAAPVQAEPVVLKPGSPWNVDFGETKCRLARFFGEGEDRHVLSFEQYWPDDQLGLMAAGRKFKPFASGKDTELQFFAEQPALRTQPMAGTAGEYGPAVIYSNVDLATGTNVVADLDQPAVRQPQLDTAFAAKVQFVSLKQGKSEVRLATGSLGEPFKILNQCTEDLVASWGLDIEQHRTMTRMPRFTNAKAVARKIMDNYPLQAVREGEGAIIRMRAIVSAEGTVESCVVMEATTTQWLDSPACQYMKRAVFEPALDAEGKPMRSYYATVIIYRVG